MLYSEKIKEAMLLSFYAHKGQVDRGGMPYFHHPLHLAEQMQTEDEVITALLHDVVEDTYITFEQLSSMGFSDTVIEALKLLTRTEDVKYMDYVKRIAGHPVAKNVKIADLKHNMDISRLPEEERDEMSSLQKRYRKALDYLESSTDD